MRVLPLLVAVESVVLVVLAVAWLRPPDQVPQVGAAPVGSVGEHPAAADRRARLRSSESGAATDSRALRREIAADDRAPATVVVRGTLSTTDGSALPEQVSVSFHRRAATRSATTRGARYAIAALEPGPWEVVARAEGYAVHTAEHVLGPAPVQAIDIALEPAHRIEVFIESVGSESIDSVLESIGFSNGLHVVPTIAPLDGDLPATDGVTVGDLGIGRYRRARNIGIPVPAEGAAGLLWLDRPPPANAALLLRHVVLAQQPIQAGQHELRFAVDADDLRASLGAVVLRLVDGATGGPVTDGRVSVGPSQGGAAQGVPDAQGNVHIENVLPGLCWLRIGHGEGLWNLVRVPAGDTLDLGEIVLHPRLQLAGRVIDEAGEPVAKARVEWTNLATMDFPRELIDNRHAMSDGDGEVSIPAGPRRYVLVARDDELRVGHAVLDARGGAPPPFEITLRPAGEIVILADLANVEAAVATVRAEGGVPVATRAFDSRWRAPALPVPRGRYTVEVHGRGERLLKREDVEVRSGARTHVEVR